MAKAQIATPAGSSLPSRLKKIPCKYWPSQCTRGASCGFLHNPALVGKQAEPEEVKVVFPQDQFLSFETGKPVEPARVVPLPTQPIGSEDKPNMEDALAELLAM